MIRYRYRLSHLCWYRVSLCGKSTAWRYSAAIPFFPTLRAYSFADEKVLSLAYALSIWAEWIICYGSFFLFITITFVWSSLSANVAYTKTIPAHRREQLVRGPKTGMRIDSGICLHSSFFFTHLLESESARKLNDGHC